MANVGYIFISDFCLQFIQSCGDGNWVRSVAMYLSHTKTHVLAGSLREVRFPTSLFLENRRKNPTLFYVCAIVAGYFLNFFLHCSNQQWLGNDGLKTLNFGVFWPLSGYQTTLLMRHRARYVFHFYIFIFRFFKDILR